jgi:hypothetical protein
LLRGTRRNCIDGRRGPTNLTATPLLTCPISRPMFLHRPLLYAHRQLRLQQGIRRHSPNLVLSILYETPTGTLERSGRARPVSQTIDIPTRWQRRRRSPKMLLAISLTRTIESGTIVTSPAVRVGMHLALPLPQLQGDNCGIFPTSLQYHGDSLWLSCG